MSALQLYVESAERARPFEIAAAIAGVPLKVTVVADAAAHPVVSSTVFESLPTLVTSKGTVVFTNAILKYLAALSATETLMGTGLFQEAEVAQWMEWTFVSLAPLLAVLANPAAASATPAETAAALKPKLPPLLAYVEGHLSSRTWLVGERLSLADVSLATALAGAWDSGVIAGKETLPNLQRWYLTCRHQPSFVKVLGAAPGPLPAAPIFAAPAAGAAAAAAPVAVAAAAGGAAAVAAPAAAPAAGVTGALTAEQAKSLALSGDALVGTGSNTVIAGRFARGRARVAEVFTAGEALIGSTITLCGWAKTVREGGAGSLVFVALTDGSCFEPIQVVCEKGKTEGFETVAGAGGTGTSLRIEGSVVKSPGKGQSIEVLASTVKVLGVVKDAAGYPLAKKKHSLEYLRDIQHLRPRTNTIGAVTRVRNACAYATHKFFQERGFLYIHTPIITTSDCEGAGEMFQVTTLAPEAGKPNTDMPRNKDGTVDYKRDFFGKPAMMTVSGQLQVEAFACAMSDVYTFGPTFRAENSHTSRHLAEFWMIEPEIAFATLAEDMALAEDYLKFCTAWVLEHCAEDLTFFESQFEKGLKDRLKNVIAEPFQKLTYTEAIELLTSPEHAAKGNFQLKPYWGVDLASEHERYITEQVFKKPVILINYPKDIKAFYMKLNSDGKTVAAMDVLVPKIGEIIGGSQREDDLDLLVKRMEEMKVPQQPLEWYLDLRRYGSCPHAGFGLGFERLVMYVTGLENIRDAIPFPRWPGNAAI